MSRPAEVAAEHDDAIGVVGQAHAHHGRAEDVPCGTERDVHARSDLDLLVEGAGLHRGQRRPRVGLGVERQGRVVLGEPPPVRVVRLLLLQVPAVGQHDLRQRGRAVRRDDRSVEAVTTQRRQVAHVVHVGVREHDGVDRGRRHPERRPVAQPQVLEPLEQAAVHQHTCSRRLEEEPAAGDRARRTEERQDRCGAARGAHCSPRLAPPSTTSDAPQMKLACWLHRNAATAPKSPGSPRCPTGMSDKVACS